MNKIFLSILTFFSLSTAAFAQEQVVEGLSYNLPKTALKFTLLIEKTTFTPGELADYANRYFMESEAVLEPSTTYRIINMRMEQVGVPDSGKRFNAKASPKNNIHEVYTTPDGLLLSVNTKPVMPEETKPFAPAAKPKPLRPREFMTQEMLSVGSQTKLAQLCAKEIYDIRDARNELSRGQAETMPKDGEQMRLMLATMDKQEKALTQLFSGVTDVDTLEQTVMFCEAGEVEKQVLFRFSDLFGLCAADDLAGAPYYISVKDLHQTPEDTRTEKEIQKAKDETGLYVCVPGRAHVTLYQQEKKWTEKDMQYAQFGRLENISGVLFNKKVETCYEVNPSVGNMHNLKTAEVLK